MTPFPQTLKRWRRRRGLSQSQAAPVLGVPIKTLQNWEEGRNTPGTLARELIAQKMAAPAQMQPIPTPIGKLETPADMARIVEDSRKAYKPFRPS